jgi:hypothetical protein
LKQKASVTNTLSVLNKSTLKEASDMKGLLHSMTAASIAAGVAVLSSIPVVASDRQTPDSGQNITGNEPSVVAQKAEDEEFASAANKADFDKDPAKYVPQYGGFCSYAVVKGVLTDLEGPDALLFTRESFTSVGMRTP